MIQDGKKFLHIDFGWCFGARPLIDADYMAIPTEMQNQLVKMNLWETFICTAVDAYGVLRRNSDLIIFLVCTAFNPILSRSTVEGWLHRSLRTPITVTQALEDFRALIISSSSRWDTWLKNRVHEVRRPLHNV